MGATAKPAIATCLNLTRAISRALAIEDIYAAALDALTEGLGVERSSVLLFDPDAVMRFKAWRGLSDGYRQAVEGHTPWRPDSTEAEPIVVPDVRKDPSLGAYLPVFRKERIGALAFIPLVANARVIGKFMLYYPKPRKLKAAELELAGVIAAQVAFAVARMWAEEAKVAVANEASRLKDEFLAVLSHELRSPLNAIVGWVRLLEKGALKPENMHEAIEIIARNARLQTRLIEDILDVSRIAAGKFELERESLDPGGIVQAAVSAMQPAAAERGVEIAVTLGERLPPIEGDARRLQQVLGNLLSNAVKFSHPGGRVEVRCHAARPEVVIEVRDGGVGIEPAFLPLIFQRFQQADSRVSRRYGGLGLGLAIARHLVEVHGGRIEAASDGPGRGALFTLRLPAAGARPAVADAWPGRGKMEALLPAVLAGLRVLVVDDDADARKLVERLMCDCGAQTASAASAQDALRLLGDSRFDIMVADLAMPEIDGFQLVRQAKASRPALLAMALTALARPEDRRRALESGFDAYASKPFEPAALITTLATLHGRAP